MTDLDGFAKQPELWDLHFNDIHADVLEARCLHHNAKRLQISTMFRSLNLCAESRFMSDQEGQRPIRESAQRLHPSLR